MTDQASSKLVRFEVTLSYGDGPTLVKLTTDVAGHGAFTSVPMRITGLHNSGGLDAKAITIDGPDSNTTFAALADGRAWPPVFLTLDEVITAYGPSGSSSKTYRHAVGDYRLQRAYRNPEREKGLIRLEFAHHKTRIKVPLGIVASPLCAWTLGDKTCGVDVAALDLDAEVSTIAGKRVSINPSTLDGATIIAEAAGYWHRGTARLDGLVIGVRKWSAGSADFELLREPPAAWAGQTITFRPGCDKTPATCTARFSNIAQFGGFGIAIPSYYPTQEIP